MRPCPVTCASRTFGRLLLASAVLIGSAGCRDSVPAPTDAGSTTGTAKLPETAARPSESGGLPPSTGGASAAPDRAAPPSGTAEPAAARDTPAASAVAQPPASPIGRPSESWRDFRNGTQLRGIAGTKLPENLELLWELGMHDGVTSTAAIDGGRVYVAALSGYVRCLDLRSAQEYWHYRTIASDDPAEFAPGFQAPVTLSDTAVFIGDEDGKFHALDRESGSELWSFETDGEIKGGATVLPPDETTGAPRVMFGSHDGKLYCLNAATGEQIWAFDTLGPVNGSQALTTDEKRSRLNGGQVIGGQYTFVAGCDRPFLRVVDVATGEQHSEIPLDQSLMIASPALVGDVLYFGTPEGAVIALNWRDQQRVWTYADPQRTQEIHSSPAATDALVLIGSRDKRLHAIDRHSGARAWTFETRGTIDSSPVVCGDRVYFGSSDRHLYGVDLSGREVWKHDAGRRITASPAIGEGHLVIGSEGPEGKLFCFGAAP